uniref:Pseudouridine-5'-phosphatase-like n=1 Tax=Dermatophagoides pteronyssinus TaxID=6956 RepID=A0A6P6YJB9_DERPT|nr:pseudouridine-5'-phosphatase-like [Dermatophagoides pteronyssinus]
MMIPITHVIFDLDGTLIDSEKHLFQSTNDVLNEFGKTFDWNIRSKTLGLHLQKSAPIIIEHFNLSIEPIDYIDKVLLRFKSYVQGDNGGYGIQLLPGVKRLVTHLSRHNIPMAICTGCKEDTFRYKTQPFGDFFRSGNLFHHFVIAGSDPEIGEQNKPNPLPYLICIERFNENGHRINPKQVLAFEDSPTGLQSAIDAGCQTIFIPDPKLDLNSLPVQPSIILKSMEHFQPEKFGLPPFNE